MELWGGIISAGIALILAFFGVWKWWVDREFTATNRNIKDTQKEQNLRIEAISAKASAEASKAETMAARASEHVARVELKMAEQRSDYVLKTDFERSMDRYFDPMFTRLDQLEEIHKQFQRDLLLAMAKRVSGE